MVSGFMRNGRRIPSPNIKPVSPPAQSGTTFKQFSSVSTPARAKAASNGASSYFSQETIGMDQGHGIIAWIIIGAIAGFLTGKLMKGSGFGFWMDLVVGIVGAMVGGFLSAHLGLGGVREHGLIMSIVIATIGAVLLTVVVRMVSGNRSANL
jgi:uncharacterized membrane protein YeaQ/YmgE (transglycosylase-associated protein family)